MKFLNQNSDESSLDKLTLLLQEARRYNEGVKAGLLLPPEPPPAKLDLSELRLRPEIEQFIRVRQEYTERTKDVFIGRY